MGDGERFRLVSRCSTLKAETMKKLIPIVLIALGACSQPRTEQPMPADPEELLSIDRGFAQMAREQGMTKAFLAYGDIGLVKYDQNEFPTVGLMALRDSLASLNDSLFNLDWEPFKAEISESGDLGYTLGRWAFSSGDTLMQHGVYVTVWKRQPDGSWKYVVDAGTKTPGEYRP